MMTSPHAGPLLSCAFPNSQLASLTPLPPLSSQERERDVLGVQVPLFRVVTADHVVPGPLLPAAALPGRDGLDLGCGSLRF